MAKTRPPYAPDFRRQMVELVPPAARLRLLTDNRRAVERTISEEIFTNAHSAGIFARHA
jgi:hypothetical protein